MAETSRAEKKKITSRDTSNTSPLQTFGKAKKEIDVIFNDINSCIGECVNFLKHEKVRDIVKPEQLQDVTRYRKEVSDILKILGRDQMKVVFFGRTSNGKSTVINAMLHADVLPTGIGHTTHCFLQVAASDNGDAYFITENSPSRHNIESLEQFTDALEQESVTCTDRSGETTVEEKSIVQVFWPKDKCKLLKHDVTLLDSPGTDYSSDLDKWIDAHCLNADVFVLVANAESTITEAEKKFIQNVSTKISKSNIFLLYNKWDASATDRRADKVKKQHMERSLSFLVDELKAMHREEAEDRILFVSAKEVLISRCHSENGTSTPPGISAEGFKERLKEFQKFEKRFEECISKSAVHTKFAPHTVNGKRLCTQLKTLLEKVSSGIAEKTNKTKQEHQNKTMILEDVERRLSLLNDDFLKNVIQMKKGLVEMVTGVLGEEVLRLKTLVDEFDGERAFTDADHRRLYQTNLHRHVEQALTQSLQERCHSQVKSKIAALVTKLKELLPKHHTNMEEPKSILQEMGRSFRATYRLDLPRYFEDFHVDYPQLQLNNTVSVVGPMALSGAVMARTGSPYLTLLVGGASALFRGMQYIYQSITLEQEAKERYKRNYVQHISVKFEQIVEDVSSSCGQQMHQELSLAFERMCRQIDIPKNRLERERQVLVKEISKLEEEETKARGLKRKADSLTNKLNSFEEQYINQKFEDN